MRVFKLIIFAGFLFCLLPGQGVEWVLIERAVFSEPIQFFQSGTANRDIARRPGYLITSGIDSVSREKTNTSIYTIAGEELFELDINARMTGLYDGIYTRLVDPNANEMYVSPDLYIYNYDGSQMGKTDFEDTQTKLLTAYGTGQYIGFNPQSGLLHVVNPQRGLYNKHVVSEKSAKSNPDGFNYRPTDYIYHQPSGLFYFVLEIDGEPFSILLNAECDLLWVKQMFVKRQTFSDKGNLMALFIGETPYSSYGDLLIIDQDGNQVSRISDVGAGGYPIEIFEDYEMLVVHDDRKTWICNYKTGEVVSEYAVGGQNYISYSPIKNYFVRSLVRPNSIVLGLYDVNDMVRLRAYSLYQLDLPTSRIPTKILDVSISHDGSEVSVLANTMYCRLKLVEVEK